MFQLESRKCPVCENSEIDNSKLIGMLSPNTLPFRNEDLKFKLVQCTVCDLVYLATLPKKNDLYKMYTEHEQFTSDTYVGERTKLIMEFYTGRLNSILDFRRISKENNKTLEIGGGLSWVSKTIKSISETNFTVAQDITSECKNVCSWVDKYYIGELEDMIDSLRQHAPYQIISMTHVFEHLIYPLDVLRLCQNLLADDGVIFITTPHRPLDWSIASQFTLWEQWSYNHVPAHIQYWNKKSIEKAAEKTGLSVVYYDASSENGQALETWLSKKSS